MAKMKKFGEAVVITSEVKLEDLRKVAKYRPKDLILFGGEDGKEPIFGVGLSKSRYGRIDKQSVEFGGCDENGFAQVTLTYDGPADDVKAQLADSYGPQLMMLSKIEEGITASIAQIDADVAAIMGNIEIG